MVREGVEKGLAAPFVMVDGMGGFVDRSVTPLAYRSASEK
jgi:hypothetical protein